MKTTPKLRMTPKMETNQKIKTTLKLWKAPKIKTTEKMEKKNKDSPNIDESLKMKTYLYCLSTCDFYP